MSEKMREGLHDSGLRFAQLSDTETAAVRGGGIIPVQQKPPPDGDPDEYAG